MRRPGRIKEPYKFYTENFLNRSGAWNLPQEQYAALCDNRKDKVFIISAEGAPEVRCTFADRYADPAERSLDTIILQEHNVRDMDVLYLPGEETEYKTLAQYRGIAGHKATLLQLNRPVKAATLAVKLLQTQGGEDEFKIGELRVCRFLFALSCTSKTQEAFDVSGGTDTTADGTLYQWINYAKWCAQVQADNLDKTQLDALRGAIKNNEPLTVVPYQDLDEGAVYECFLSQKIKASLNRLTGLYDADFELKER